MRGLETPKINRKLSFGITKVGAMRGLGVWCLTEDIYSVCREVRCERDTSVSHTRLKSKEKSALSKTQVLN